MAHRSKVLYWQAVENQGFGYTSKRWIVYAGPPDDENSEVIFELSDEDYRPYIKGLPVFKDGEVLTARMAFVSAKLRGKKNAKLDD